jgi:hypothetical protein
VWQFDWNAAFDVLVQIVVLVPLATVAIVFIATSIGSKRVFYSKFIYEKLDFSREMSLFAATAAMVVSQFQRWKAEGGGGGRAAMSKADLAAVFKPTIEGKRAEQLAELITRRADTDGNGALECKELINVSSFPVSVIDPSVGTLTDLYLSLTILGTQPQDPDENYV